MADKPTIVWDENEPGPGSPFIMGDNRIREMKTQIREIMEADHVFESESNGDNWGYHSQVTLMECTTNPTAVTDAFIFFTKEATYISELYCINESSTTQQLTSQGKFIGGMQNEIRMFSGLLIDIPVGWKLCDGNGGTWNLTGRFACGIATATTTPSATVKGSDTHTVTVLQMPSHTHTQTTSGTHTHRINGRVFGEPSTDTLLVAENNYLAANTYTVQLSTDTHNHTVTGFGSLYGVTAYNTRPVYYELAFIQR